MSRQYMALTVAITCLLSAFCSDLALGSGHDEPGHDEPVALATRHLADNANWFIMADVSRILANPVVNLYCRPRLERLLNKAPPGIELWFDRCGFDPLKDISFVVLSAKTLGPKPEELLLVLHGQFREDLFREAFLQAVMQRMARHSYVSHGESAWDVFKALVQLASVPAEAVVLPLASESPVVTDTVHAVGMGDEETWWRYTSGAVRQVAQVQSEGTAPGGRSLTRRTVARVISADCALRPGDSGGPLVNNRGQLVGVSHAAPKGARRLSKFIDVAEARDFLAGAGLDQPVTIVVDVPANADLHVQGILVPGQGGVRRFSTAPLGIAKRYSYQIKATWQADGQSITREQRIEFCAGDTLQVTFSDRD